MTPAGRPLPPLPPESEAAEGIARIEDYLLALGELRAARSEAESFAGGLPWLTRAQSEEVVRRYAEERQLLSRRLLDTLAARRAQLAEEYAARQLALRRRLLCTSVAVCLGSATLLACTCLLIALHRG